MDSRLQSGKRVRALGPGGKPGVVSPASRADAAALEAGCRALTSSAAGRLQPPTVGCSAIATLPERPRPARRLDGNVAGHDVDAILCARGGYGSNYLLPLLDFDAPMTRRKRSWDTATTPAVAGAGARRIVSFHGPMVASDFARGMRMRVRFAPR